MDYKIRDLELAGFGFFHQLLDIGDAGGGVDHQEQRLAAGLDDGREVVQNVVSRARVGLQHQRGG